jgi:hypothetical protein
MKKQSFYLKSIIAFLAAAAVFAAGCIEGPAGFNSIAGPAVQTFEASPAVTTAGQATSLRWTTSNAQSVYIDNGVGAVALSGTIAVSPGSTAVYTLTARNVAGTAVARTNIIVRGTQSVLPSGNVTLPPVIALFAPDRAIIPAGEYALLRWNVSNSDRVSIDQVGSVNPSGELKVYPGVTTTYTLTAANESGDSVAWLTVTVLPSPLAGYGNTLMTLIPVYGESGSLVKGYQHLDYSKRAEICAGDTSLNLASRAFLSFDISVIPENAVIEEAVLDLGDYAKTGDPSYARSAWGNMGAIELYHVQYNAYEDPGAAAYNDSSRRVQNGTFNDYPLSPWTIDVKNAADGTAVLQNLVTQGSERFQLRLQFFTSTNWDSIADMLCFPSARLTIKYHLASL